MAVQNLARILGHNSIKIIGSLRLVAEIFQPDKKKCQKGDRNAPFTGARGRAG